MSGESGFSNSAAGTVIPNAFFARILPEITDPAELIVSAYVFFAFTNSAHRPRLVTLRELEADAGLARTLANLCEGAVADSLRRGLDLAVERGTLLRASTAPPAPPQADGAEAPSLRDGSQPRTDMPSGLSARGGEAGGTLFAPNMPANRRALERLAAEGVSLEEPLPAAEGEPAPNIYTLYEQTIGGITPLIADDLRDAEQRYPPEWIREAFHEAAELNKRNWRYIQRILERWETEGPNYATDGRDPETDWLARRYSAGKRQPARPGS
jgi:DnaD/phage-associated family protein